MRINSILKDKLNTSILKRVRVKVDPASVESIKRSGSFEYSYTYEGYVLEEDGSSLKVYVVGLPDGFDEVQDVNKDNIEYCDGNNITPDIKNKILNQLKKEGISEDSPLYGQIKNSNSFDFIESFLKQNNFDDSKLNKIYKNIILNV